MRLRLRDPAFSIPGPPKPFDSGYGTQMNRDLHPELGPRQRVESLEACLQRVRERQPRAHMEGSTGRERSFWVDKRLVGHAWPVARQAEAMWLRISP